MRCFVGFFFSLFDVGLFDQTMDCKFSELEAAADDEEDMSIRFICNALFIFARVLDSVVLFLCFFVIEFLVSSMVPFLEDDDDNVSEMSVISCNFSSRVLLLDLMSSFFLNLLGDPILSVDPDDDEDLSSFIDLSLTSLSFDSSSLLSVALFREKWSFGLVADSC